MRDVFDVLTEQLLNSMPVMPVNVPQASTPGTNNVTRPGTGGRTVQMWMVGDPFTEDYFFGGPYIPNGGELIEPDGGIIRY